jgi:serine protease Do
VSLGRNRSSSGGALVVRVAEDRAAGKAGLRPGDMIVAVNREPVRSVEALDQVVEDARAHDRKSALLLCDRHSG